MSETRNLPSIMLPVLVSLFIAVLLMAVPLPDMLAGVRPEWMALVVFYWGLYSNGRYGVAAAWLSGLLLDVLDGNLLGVQALSMSGVAYIALVLQQRLKLYPIPHQSLVVFLVVGLHLSFVHWVNGLFGIVSSGYSYLLPAIPSAIFWPLVSIPLVILQRTLRS